MTARDVARGTVCIESEPVRTMSREQERRRYARLSEPFPVRVRGVDACGEAFVVETVLDNLSGGGLYVRLTQRVEVGAKLFAVVRVSTDPRLWTPAARVAMRGVVQRVEPQPNGTYGMGVAFTHHRFLYR